MADDPTLTPRPETSMSARPEPRAGVAPIKPEYLLDTTPITDKVDARDLNNDRLHMDDAAEGRTTPGESEGSGRDAKRRKTKKDRGQNKARQFPIIREAGPQLCRQWEKTGECGRKSCKFQHGWDGYFTQKPSDVRFDPEGVLSADEPFVEHKAGNVGGEDEVGRTIELGTTCPVMRDLGYCPYGWRCRFLGGHVRRLGAGDGEASTGQVFGEWELLGQRSKDESSGRWRGKEINWPDNGLFARLRTNEYPLPITTRYLAKIEPDKPFTLSRPTKPSHGAKAQAQAQTQATGPKGNKRPLSPSFADEEGAMNETSAAGAAGTTEEEEWNAEAAAEKIIVSAEEAALSGLQSGADEMESMEVALAPLEGKLDSIGNGVKDAADKSSTHPAYAETEAIDVPLRPEEKKRLRWEGGLYLAPLTTVGNLPFRRLCVSYGASITISEMALSQPLITGHSDEFALLRRHESEKMFGVQLAGGYANRMVPAAEMIAREFGDGVDFVDVNLGCPIDLVFNQGAGSALMDAPGRLGKILVGMNRALGEIPLTVKFRTGVASGKPNAHKLVPRFATEWGAGALTLHGRSRQQRYSKLADWSYIKSCASVLRESLAEANLPPVPIFGNGDCYSAQSYYDEMDASGVDGIMVARGALIKPWIFTEIKERREWDISATERLEGIRKFAEFGLSHWGSDTQGISKTRRFLCEALSFQHRYIPIGLLERMPPMLNERPPAYRGRNELETLLASPFVGDWVRISEMFLGKAEEGWGFVPKHKSNAYGGEEAQG